MTHLGLIIFIIISFEILKLSKLIELLKHNMIFYRKLFKLLKSKKISDTWKEKALLYYSRKLFFSSIKIILVLGIIMLILLLISYLDSGFYEFVFSLFGLIEMSILFLAYTYLRKYLNEKI